MAANERRVVITGLGVIAAVGNGVPDFWNALCQGKFGGKTITCFDSSCHRTKIACEIPEIPVARKDQTLSRVIRIGLVAFNESLKNAQLQNIKCERVGISVGLGAGSQLESEQFYNKFRAQRRITRLIRYATMNSLADYLAYRYHFTGPRNTISTACSSSTTAIGYAFDQIKLGRATVMIAGGAESLSEVTFGGFNSMRVVAKAICQPFDLNRQGILLGEGGAFLVLEELQHAINRGAKVLAEVLGYGIDNDAYHITAPHSAGVAKAIQSALLNSGISASQVDYINAHGTGTIHNDLAETQAIKEAFGSHAYNVKISSIKAMIGHCLGAAGALEAVATVLSLQNGIIPPTINYQTPDPQCDLDYVPNQAQKKSLKLALSNSLAFGGNNAILVLGRV